MATKSASKQEGNVKSTATYDCDPSGFGYSVITPDIAADFDFLNNELPNKLDEVLTHIDNAANITGAFQFDTVSDISAARDELQKDIEDLKTNLKTLHSAFMTDIDNINAELEYNFGWIIIGKVKGSTKNEVVEQTTTS